MTADERILPCPAPAPALPLPWLACSSLGVGTLLSVTARLAPLGTAEREPETQVYLLLVGYMSVIGQGLPVKVFKSHQIRTTFCGPHRVTDCRVSRFSAARKCSARELRKVTSALFETRETAYVISMPTRIGTRVRAPCAITAKVLAMQLYPSAPIYPTGPTSSAANSDLNDVAEIDASGHPSGLPPKVII